MKFPALGVIAVIMIFALAASILFWLRLFQTEKLPSQPADVCATYEERWHDICKQTVEFVQERFHGEIVKVELLPDVQQETEFVLPSPPEERFWHITMQLDSPAQFEDQQLQGEVGIFVNKPGNALMAYSYYSGR
ncbi:MAG: hypothetical protein AAB524_01980 [Patescibacteria group bacterium]